MLKYDFSGRLALVTGAGSGLGRAVATALADAGCAVVLADINLGAADQTLELLKNKSHHFSCHTDVSQEDSVTKLQQAIKFKFNRTPSIIFHAAGIVASGTRQSAFEITVEEWSRVFDVNTKGTFLVNKVFGRAMRDEQVTNGSIVNFSSLASKTHLANMVDYCSSKAAVNAITACFGAELGPYGIRVNAIAPTFVDTPLLRKFAGDAIQAIVAKTPLGRICNEKDVISLCMFLASDDSSMITKEVIFISGGFE